MAVFGAGNETRTRDPDLGKVVLYQLSYSRFFLHLTALLLQFYYNFTAFFLVSHRGEDCVERGAHSNAIPF